MRRALLLLTAIAFLITGCERPAPAPVVPVPAGKTLTVAFLDVWQGDAILVRGPSGMTMLIDGAREDDGPAVILSTLKAWGVQKLDLLVATHPDADHVGGLAAVVAGIPVQNAALTGQAHTTQAYERLLTEIRNRDVKAIRTRTGTALPFDPDVQLSVLGPGDAAVEGDDLNNASIVIKLVYGQVSFLFTGDAEMDEYRAIQAAGGDLRCTVLKIGHHGSYTSTDEALLRTMQPQIAVISVGAGNRYGHPHDSVLSALVRRQVRVYRTDQSGTVTITTDGTTPVVKTEK